MVIGFGHMLVIGIGIGIGIGIDTIESENGVYRVQNNAIGYQTKVVWEVISMSLQTN